MSHDIPLVLESLDALVGFDTQNPPRNLTRESEIFGFLAHWLGPGFAIDIKDHGLGRIGFFAVRGKPGIIFNVHLDTVPVLEGARFDPLQLTQSEDRVYGRGACDIKGAAACLLALARTSDAPLALLFTTDEEGGEGCCVQNFLDDLPAGSYSQAIVAEPTRCLAEFSHRGFLSVRGRFSGIAGHSSEARALEDNALHRMARWMAAAVGHASEMAQRGASSCLNIGTVSGGVKSNVIADHGEVFWSARLPGGHSNDAFLADLQALQGGGQASWTVSFSGPPLPQAGQDAAAAMRFAEQAGLACGAGLDFWTEASLFSAAGVPAIVLGPGDIAQAHAVDEWVSIDQLQMALNIYRQVVENDV